MPAKKTTEQFIADARKRFDDSYDYSKVKYINATTPVTIVCRTHGEFRKAPNRFPSEPTLMQKLIVHRMRSRSSYANWSGMGSGKTLAALMSSRDCGARVTLVVAPKDVIVQSWVPQIRTAYPDAEVWTNINDIPGDELRQFSSSLDLRPSGNTFVYILVNYEKFSSDAGYVELRDALLGIHPDFVSLDEVQYIKVASDRSASHRHNNVADFVWRQREGNPSAKVHVISGTPVINNLREPNSLIDILMMRNGRAERSSRVMVRNIHSVYKDILRNGFRYKVDITGGVDVVTPEIMDPRIGESIASLGKEPGVLSVERVLALRKLTDAGVRNLIRKGTIIYTTYVDGIVEPAMDTVRSLGLSVEAYTGSSEDRAGIFRRFISGETDVIIASRPVILGVDGLQNRSGRIIVLSLPWTWADFEQLIARINRPRQKGSALSCITPEVVIPQVVVPVDDIQWSWDRRRLSLIRNKRTLGEAVIDGYIEKVYQVNQNELVSEAVEALKQAVRKERQK